jgi:CRP-like cAMP-binding protein
MHQIIISYINKHNTEPLNKDDELLISSSFQHKKLRKKQYFLQEGEVCKYTGFIIKGAMRMYSVDENGIEHILHLYIENYWATDRESSIMLTPSRYNIEAWEDTELLVISRAEMLELMEKIPALVKMFQKLDERNAIASHRRLNSSISSNAEERYKEFSKNYPQFIQRFPQHIIASYLGITKETLSRIRKQIMK